MYCNIQYWTHIVILTSSSSIIIFARMTHLSSFIFYNVFLKINNHHAQQKVQRKKINLHNMQIFEVQSFHLCVFVSQAGQRDCSEV